MSFNDWMIGSHFIVQTCNFSNLMYISKLIERVEASRLHPHMIINDLYEEYQSSYRKLHSTETALVSVHDDMLRAINDNKCILLIMLDLSACI